MVKFQSVLHVEQVWSELKNFFWLTTKNSTKALNDYRLEDLWGLDFQAKIFPRNFFSFFANCPGSRTGAGGALFPFKKNRLFAFIPIT